MTIPITASRDTTTLAGPKILLMGLSGTGKTYSLGTLAEWCAENGMEMAVLFTENSVESLLGYFRDNKKEPPACLYWHQQLTRAVGLDALLTAADNVGKLSYEMVTKLQDTSRGGTNNPFMGILQSCKEFVDDRTGKSLGNVGMFPPNRVFVIDSLTELSNAAMKMVIGSRPTAAPPDYGVAQNNLMNFLRFFTQGTPFPFVITSHVDRNTDEVTQSTKIMVKSIGRALYTDIPPLFSEVIYAVREGPKFTWDTAAYGVDCKTRSLGYRAGIPPTFAGIMDVWKKRAGL